ncbi:MAG: phosphoglucosamine mutase [Erysipelotrichaceae bacterium]
MGKYFGTDGVRGKANEVLTVDMAYRIGKYLGYYFSQKKKGKIVLGKDTRISSSMFEHALATGIVEAGCDAYLVGYTSTPSMSYIVKSEDFDCAVMISASHNPYYDNGIKILSDVGMKMDEEILLKIEDFIDGKVTVNSASSDHIGKVVDYSIGRTHYINHIISLFKDVDLSNYQCLLDLANGSSSFTAKEIFDGLNIKYDVICDQPDGININNNCGSTHLDLVKKTIKKGKYDLGFAFDGDADRLIALLNDGTEITGDHILYVGGRYLKDHHALKDNVVVTTVMSNIGLHKALDRSNISTVITPVGDKYVYESMNNNDYKIGGEQSGHIIFKDYTVSGDGVLNALLLLKIMKESNMTMEELVSDLAIFPQLLVNLTVNDKGILNHELIEAKIAEVDTLLKDQGRVLVRTSGTEPLIRVMVEASSDELCKKYVYDIIDEIKRVEKL